MMLLGLYGLALLAIATGTGAIYMALLEPFPLWWLYWHSFVRKPIAWSLLVGASAWVAHATIQTGSFPWSSLPPWVLVALGLVLTYRMHQEVAFPAIDDPPLADDPLTLPLDDDAEMAVVEYGGVTRAYALDHVIHHHIINDHFGDRLVALTYCAMCRTVIPFDVTDIGPLFVASFKNANMIMADRRTHTFFQQASLESVLGKLHPHTLTMLPFQMLPWAEVKRLVPMPEVARVTEHDLRAFELPIPGVWSRIMASEATPGLAAKHRDETLPARTRVVGLRGDPPRAWLKTELTERGLLEVAPELTLVAVGSTVNAFRAHGLRLDDEHRLTDAAGSTWDLRGKRLTGDGADLEPVAVSDEYWFSWKRFHPTTKLVLS